MDSLLAETQAARTQIQNNQSTQAANKLLFLLRQNPNHFLKAYWLYLLAQTPNQNAEIAIYLEHPGELKPYFYWWKALATPPEQNCQTWFTLFASTLHLTKNPPRISSEDKKFLSTQMDCLRGLSESARLVLADYFIKQKVFYLVTGILRETTMPLGFYFKGLAYQRINKYKAAFSAYERATSFPASTQQALIIQKKAIIGAGLTKRYLKKYNEAYRWWSRISTSDKDFYPEVLWQKGVVALKQNRDQNAYQHFHQLYSGFPNHEKAPEALWYTLRTAIQRNDYSNILPYAKALIQYKDTEHKGAATYWLARSLEKQGQRQQARQYYQTLSQGPLNDYYTHMGKCRYEGRNCYSITNYTPLNPVSSRPDIIDRSPLVKYLLDQRAYKGLRILLPFTGLNEIEQKMVESYLFLLEGNYFRSIRHIWTIKTRDTSFLRLMYPAHYLQIIQKNAQELGIPTALISGLIWQESMYKANIRSSAGATGLMQLMPATAKGVARRVGLSPFSLGMLTNPEINIKLGSSYLKTQLSNWDNNPAFALSNYNAGPGNTAKWRRRFGHLPPDAFIEQITFKETRRYVKMVLSHFWVYNTIYKQK